MVARREGFEAGFSQRPPCGGASGAEAGPGEVRPRYAGADDDALGAAAGEEGGEAGVLLGLLLLLRLLLRRSRCCCCAAGGGRGRGRGGGGGGGRSSGGGRGRSHAHLRRRRAERLGGEQRAQGPRVGEAVGEDEEDVADGEEERLGVLCD